MLSEILGWVIIILPILIIVYVLIFWIRGIGKHKKDCDKSTGKQKELNNFLFQAVANGDAQKVKEAVAAGANVNVRGLGGKTPLIIIIHRAANPKHYHDAVNLEIYPDFHRK